MTNDDDREYGAADETGVPTVMVDAVLARWAGTMPPGYTATDALRAADTSYIHEARNLARLAVLEVQDRLGVPLRISTGRAPEPGTGELGSWKPEVVTAVDALRDLDWTGFDPASLDDLADIAAAVVGALNPGPDIADVLPASTD